VERGCVTAAQYRCEHSCEVVAGTYDRSAKGTRCTVPTGRSGAAAVLVFWKDRTADPSPRESAALRKLFAGLECSCMTAAARLSPGNARYDVGPSRKTLSRLFVAAQLDKVWAAIVESAERLSLLRIKLEVEMPWLAEGFNATWEKEPPEETTKSWRIDVPVMSGARVVGWLRVNGDSSRASNRHDIAHLLEVLDTSESYLESVFREQGQAPVPGSAPYSDLVRDRAAQAMAETVEESLEQVIENVEKVDVSH